MDTSSVNSEGTETEPAVQPQVGSRPCHTDEFFIE